MNNRVIINNGVLQQHVVVAPNNNRDREEDDDDRLLFQPNPPQNDAAPKPISPDEKAKIERFFFKGTTYKKGSSTEFETTHVCCICNEEVCFNGAKKPYVEGTFFAPNHRGTNRECPSASAINHWVAKHRNKFPTKKDLDDYIDEKINKKDNTVSVAVNIERNYCGVIPLSGENDRLVLRLAASFLPYDTFDQCRGNQGEWTRWAHGVKADAPIKSETMKKATIDLHRRLRAEQLKANKGRMCTLAIDKGTIERKEIMAFTLHFFGDTSPFLWKLNDISLDANYNVVDENLQKTGTSATGSAIAADIISSYAQLKELGILVVAIVTDNGANMLAAVRIAAAAHHRGRRQCPIVSIPCFAHTAQLAVRDAVSSRAEWIRLIQRAKAIRAALLPPRDGFSMCLPECCPTRWSSEMRLIIAILRHHGSFPPEHQFSQQEFRLARQFVDEFDPARIFTNFVQRDKASFGESLCGLSTLFGGEALGATLEDRALTFYSPIAIIFCFFSPSFHFPTFITDLQGADRANEISDLISIVNRSIDAIAPFIDSLHEFRRAQGHDPLTITVAGLKSEVGGNVNAFDAKYGLRRRLCEINDGVTWSKWFGMLDNPTSIFNQHFPHSTALILVLKDVCPTEASCERVFSLLKKVMRRQRSRLTVDNAAAALEITFLMNSKWELAKTVEGEDDDEVADEGIGPAGGGEDGDRNEEPELTRNIAVAMLDGAIKKYRKEAEANGDVRCPKCKNRLQDQTTLQCTRCHSRTCWILDCAKKLSPSMTELPAVEELGTWLCDNCYSEDNM